MDKKLFFYELEGRGYTFQNKNWDEVKHGFEDDMLNMAWEMWSLGKAAKAQAVPEGFLLMPRKCTNKMAHAAKAVDGRLSAFKYADVYDAMVEAREQSND